MKNVKKSIKKWLAGLLALLLALGLWPAAVFAEEQFAYTHLFINGIDILEEENCTIECGGGTASYNRKTYTLTLTNATIEIEENGRQGIFFDFISKDPDETGETFMDPTIVQTIVLVGENKISAKENVKNTTGVSCHNSLRITGSGSLTISSVNRNGISVEGGLEIDGATLNVTSDDMGIYANQEDVKILNADITVNSAYQSISAVLRGHLGVSSAQIYESFI